MSITTQIKNSKFYNEEFTSYNATSEEAVEYLQSLGFTPIDKSNRNLKEYTESTVSVIIGWERSLTKKDSSNPIFGELVKLEVLTQEFQKAEKAKGMEETIRQLKYFKDKFGNFPGRDAGKMYKEAKLTQKEFITFSKLTSSLPLFGKDWFEY